MLLRESELILWTHLSLVSKDAPIPSVSILNFWLTPSPKSIYKTNAALAVWIIFIHMLEVRCDALTLCMIPASVESPQNLHCHSEQLLGAAYSAALISAPSSLPPKDYQILIYSSEHLSSTVFLIHLAGHARPNSCNPGACGVCARFPALSRSRRRPLQPLFKWWLWIFIASGGVESRPPLNDYWW